MTCSRSWLRPRHPDGVRFHLEQRFAVPADAVMDAFADPGFYPELAKLPNVGEPAVVSCARDGTVVRMQVRYRFTGDLSAAARRVIDPHRLTWVDHSTIDLAARRAVFDMRADHYADRFRCNGAYTVDDTGSGASQRLVDGELSVRAPLVGRAVERAILSGLERHLGDEVEVVERWVASK